MGSGAFDAMKSVTNLFLLLELDYADWIRMILLTIKVCFFPLLASRENCILASSSLSLDDDAQVHYGLGKGRER